MYMYLSNLSIVLIISSSVGIDPTTDNMIVSISSKLANINDNNNNSYNDNESTKVLNPHVLNQLSSVMYSFYTGTNIQSTL